MHFKSKREIFWIQNDPITIKDWVHERDYYTRIQMLTKYFSSRKYIFDVELENVVIEMHNKIQYPVMVSLPEVFILRNVSCHENSYLKTNCNGQKTCF